MSVLSRIPGWGPLAAVLAHTASIHSNPTLRRYNDILATTFYHHGRFCASNQATVIFSSSSLSASSPTQASSPPTTPLPMLDSTARQPVPSVCPWPRPRPLHTRTPASSTIPQATSISFGHSTTTVSSPPSGRRIQRLQPESTLCSPFGLPGARYYQRHTTPCSQ
ncbi:unnamed protein product [Mortierella alpina]